MDKGQTKFYEIFTELQCFILANMNRGQVNGVSATHYNIIEYVYRNDKCTGKQVANAFNISPAAVSKQLKFLIGNNLIKQEQSSRDRRIFNMSVTDSGKFIIDNSENFRETVAKKVSNALNKDDLENLTALLYNMMSEIKK